MAYGDAESRRRARKQAAALFRVLDAPPPRKRKAVTTDSNRSYVDFNDADHAALGDIALHLSVTRAEVLRRLIRAEHRRVSRGPMPTAPTRRIPRGVSAMQLTLWEASVD